MPKQHKHKGAAGGGARAASASSAPSDGWDEAQAELDALILENAAATAAKEAEEKAAAPPPPTLPPPSPPPAPAVKVLVRRCCVKCQGDNPTLMCPLCKTYYCSAACQAAHWPLHKDQCGVMAELLEHNVIAKARVKNREGDVDVRCYEAARMGRLSDCERMILEERPDLNWCPERGFTANSVYAAAQSGHARVVALLLRHGGRADVYSSKGYTPLAVASLWGHELVVQTLLEHGVEVDAANRNDLGSAALSLAAEKGRASVVALLLAAGAVVDLPRSDGVTALLMASHAGHVKVVRRLLRAGADPLRPANNGDTPLHRAIAENHTPIVTLLQARIAEMACETASQPTAAAAAAAAAEYPEAPGL